MNLHLSTVVAFLACVTTGAATASLLPAQILCTPDDHHRAGIEESVYPGSTAQLFEYGGKVTVTSEGPGLHYEYGAGKDFYTVREKNPYTKDFIDLKHEIFVLSNANVEDRISPIFLKGSPEGDFFHIDRASHRYYGYITGPGAVDTYSGTCSILKN